MDPQVAGMVGILLLVANLWAVLSVAVMRADRDAKFAWATVIMAMPLLGLLLWLGLGPRPAGGPAGH